MFTQVPNVEGLLQEQTLCMDPSAVWHDVHAKTARGGQLRLTQRVPHTRVCTHCLDSLTRSIVPPCSFVRVDVGPTPAHLPPVSLLESRCVAPGRASHRDILFLGRITGPKDQRQQAMRGHLVATSAPAGDAIVKAFPCPAAEIPDTMRVVLTNTAKTRAQIASLLDRAESLRINGQNVVQWSNHVAAVHLPVLKGYVNTKLDSDALQWYNDLGDAVPGVFADYAVAPQNAVHAAALRKAYSQQRTGYDEARVAQTMTVSMLRRNEF